MSPREMRPNEVSAGGVVVRRGGAADVCLINDGRYWGLPKGNVERGEQPEEAALREIHEEVGLPREALRLLAGLPASDYVYRRSGRLIFKRVHHVLVEAVGDTALHPDGHEVTEAVWLPFDEARRRVSFRDTVRVLDAALAILEASGGVHATP